jgi:hypothetical protein
MCEALYSIPTTKPKKEEEEARKEDYKTVLRLRKRRFK